MEKGNILVVVAMEVEAKVLLKKFDNYEIKSKMGFTFYEISVDDRKIILLLSGVGVINASSGLTVGIMEYKPSYIINYGIAGAMSKNIHTKDIIIGESVININSYKTAELKEGAGSNPNTWELLTFLSGQPDKYIEYSADNKLLELVKEINSNNENIIYGKIGSGDVWNREVDRILYLNSNYGIIVEDMESIAIYSIASRYGIPVIAIKIISDNSLIGEEYNREVGIYLQNFIYEYLKKLTNKKIDN